MKCENCSLWNQMEVKKIKIDRGSCMNHCFSGPYGTPQITVGSTNCSQGILKKSRSKK